MYIEIDVQELIDRGDGVLESGEYLGTLRLPLEYAPLQYGEELIFDGDVELHISPDTIRREFFSEEYRQGRPTLPSWCYLATARPNAGLTRDRLHEVLRKFDFITVVS